VNLRAAIAAAASLALLGCGCGGGAPQRQQAAHRPASSPSASAVIDGIACSYPGSTPVHYHAHLDLFSSGRPRPVSYGIGVVDPVLQQTDSGPYVVSGSCFFRLHSHATDGIIHVEADEPGTYTLGQYFDIWGQRLSATGVGTEEGPVTAYVNGERYEADPRGIPLQRHDVIQLDVGTDVPPQPYVFPASLP
jgi:hypothetical protein